MSFSNILKYLHPIFYFRPSGPSSALISSIKSAKSSGGGGMDSVEGIAREIEVLDSYAERLRQQIDAAQRELARVTRRKQQLLAEVSRLKKARMVAAV